MKIVTDKISPLANYGIVEEDGSRCLLIQPDEGGTVYVSYYKPNKELYNNYYKHDIVYIVKNIQSSNCPVYQFKNGLEALKWLTGK